MTRSPEKAGAPRETKPRDPQQRPNTGGGKTDASGGEGTKNYPHPTNPGADTRWRQRSGATGRDGDGERGGGGKDGDKSRRRGAPGSTPHRRGFGRGSGRPCRRVPRQTRRQEKRRRRVLASIYPRRGSGYVRGSPSGREAGAVVRHSPGDGRGDDTPRRESATRSTADEAMAERSPPKRP